MQDATEQGAPIPAVLYAAKSTDDVRGSIPSQLAAVGEAIQREGGREVISKHHDEAMSGFTGSRGPGLTEAIEAAKQAAEHGGAELWAFDSDRFARGDGQRARHLGGLYFDLLQANVKLRAVRGDNDLADPIHAVLRGERNHQDSEAKSGHVRRESAKRRSAASGSARCPTATGWSAKLMTTGGSRAAWSSTPSGSRSFG